MKKVKATNRTEVAYKIKDLFPLASASSTEGMKGSEH
jgi:hypothetical protein